MPPRFPEVSPAAAAAIATAFLKDQIAYGVVPPEMAYLACDPNKIARARKAVMKDSQSKDKEKYEDEKIVGIGYDGRRDKHTRAMVADSTGKLRMRMVTEEHESVTEEPSGRYIGHFVPEAPVHPEKPALKVAQGLLEILEQRDSTDSLLFLAGDSTNTNTGWRGGTHAHLERLLGRRLYWGICNLHTNELPLRHLITTLDGPTSSAEGFMGPVCSLLSRVNEMAYDSKFRPLPGGEDLIAMTEKTVDGMSSDQRTSYRLVKAVKEGSLPQAMQEMQCGPLCHARWLTTGQRLVFMWTRHHGLSGENLKTLEILVKFCLQFYFKIFFEIKVKHQIVDAPFHILTTLRLLKAQPKKVRDAITFYVRTGAWYAHPECLLLSLLASPTDSDRHFAIAQIMKLRGDREYGDNSLRPRVTPKLNLSATSLTRLISWKPGTVQEPSFTCVLSKEEIQAFKEKPYSPPNFCCHTQATERAVKLTTQAAAAVCGQAARDGFIRARLHSREEMPVFTSKKHILATFK